MSTSCSCWDCFGSWIKTGINMTLFSRSTIAVFYVISTFSDNFEAFGRSSVVFYSVRVSWAMGCTKAWPNKHGWDIKLFSMTPCGSNLSQFDLFSNVRFIGSWSPNLKKCQSRCRCYQMTLKFFRFSLPILQYFWAVIFKSSGNICSGNKFVRIMRLTSKREDKLGTARVGTARKPRSKYVIFTLHFLHILLKK